MVYENAKLCYLKWGHGPDALVCFHGYGLNKNAFDGFETLLSPHFTVYSFDLFAHGESQWLYRNSILSKSEWAKIFDAFLQAEAIDSFSVMAYSMGGKVALATLEHFSHKIYSMIMVAPDGIYTNPWYRLATYPGMFNHIFKKIIYKPAAFLKTVEVLGNYNLLKKGLVKFVSNEMNSPAKRERVYQSWMIYRQFLFNKNLISRLIQRNHIKTLWVFGQYDYIINVEKFGSFLENISSGECVVLPTGHSDLLKILPRYPEHLKILLA